MQDTYAQPDFDELLTRGDSGQLAIAIEEHGSAATGHIDQLIAHDDEMVRAAAVQMIAQLGLSTCKPLLLGLTGDLSDLVRTDALTALFDLGYPLDDFFVAADRLRLDPDPDVRATALAMLYVATADEHLLEDLSRLLLNDSCQYHTQYVALNAFACYLSLDRHPGVVQLLKAIRNRLEDSMDLAHDIDEALATAEDQ